MQEIHAAIIMDGNGRWATRRGMPRQAGHAAGVEALGRVVEAAPRLGIGMLTVYAFSADNWQRPQAEVGALMGLLSSTKYEFCIEFSHADETGVQWITAARSRHVADYEAFKAQAARLKERLG